MTQTETIQNYVLALSEKQQIFQRSLETFITQMASNQQEIKITTARNCYDAAITVVNLLAVKVRPTWLNVIVNSLSDYLNTHDKSKSNDTLLRKIIPHFTEAINYRWMPEEFTKEEIVDFDEIYQRCKKETQINELFDKSVELLNQIIESGEVDSIRIKKSLEKLLSTMRNHTEKSYLNMILSFDFAKSMAKNTLSEYMKESPLYRAFLKTLDDAGIEIGILNEKIRKEIKDIFESQIFLQGKNITMLE